MRFAPATFAVAVLVSVIVGAAKTGSTLSIDDACGKKIAVARLEALPFAALCIECKSREERRR